VTVRRPQARRIVTLPDIAAFGIGEAGRRYDEKRLAERRR
jgi:hypothetical protein